jgi:hypothetical protein
MGAPYGNECVASVQTVLKDAGLSQIGGGVLGVDAFTSDLLSSGYSKVSQSDASAGDIVNLGGDHGSFQFE